MSRISSLVLVVFALFLFQTAIGQLRLQPAAVSPFAYEDDEEELEEEEDLFKGFSITLNLGAYLASKKSANVYNGTCGFNLLGSEDLEGIRCWTISERLDPDIFTIDSQNILNAVDGATGYSVPYDAAPTNMGYQPAFMVGVNMKYSFSMTSSIFVELNAVRLKAVDSYTLQFVGTGQQINAQNDVRIYTIEGREQRFHLMLAYRHGWMINDYSIFYFDIGGSMLGAQMQENLITVPYQSGNGAAGQRQLNLVAYSTTYSPLGGAAFQPRTGLGFGAFAGLGTEFIFADRLRMDIGVILSRDKVIIEDFEDNMINTSIVARFGI